MRRIAWVFAALVAVLSASCGQIPLTPPQMTEASAPPGLDAPGARWSKLVGANGHTFLTAVLTPEGTGPFPVVVILHGASGLSKGFIALAEEVAHAGFLVVVGCWQAGEAKTPGNVVCADATPQADWIADPAANSGKELIAMAKRLPNAQANRVGLYGISRGGHAALWAASTGAGVKAVVADAPAHRPAISPAPASPQDVLTRLDVPLLILHGTADQSIPVEQSREYERAARALGKSVAAVYFDGVGHMPTFQPASQVEARQRAIAFFREKL